MKGKIEDGSFKQMEKDNTYQKKFSSKNKDVFRAIVRLDMVSIYQKTEAYMRAFGEMDKRITLAPSSGVEEADFGGSLRIMKDKREAYTHGLMEKANTIQMLFSSMKAVVYQEIVKTPLVYIFGKAEACMQEYGLMQRNTSLVHRFGRMEPRFEGYTQKEIERVEDSFNGQMAAQNTIQKSLSTKRLLFYRKGKSNCKN